MVIFVILQRWALGGNDSDTTSARGGGLVRMTAAEMELHGGIRADGASGYSSYAGGGSGGGIRLDLGQLSGTGSITANGGNSGYSDGGSGGGGRIAVYYGTNALPQANVQCAGGSEHHVGGPGSIFWKANSAAEGLVYFDNLGHGTSENPTPISLQANDTSYLDFGTGAYVRVTLDGDFYFASVTSRNAKVEMLGNWKADHMMVQDGSWEQSGTIQLDDRLTLEGNATLRHSTGWTNGLQIVAGNLITVNTNASIDVSGRGLLGSTSGDSGGSYGGRGGNYNVTVHCYLWRFQKSG